MMCKCEKKETVINSIRAKLNAQVIHEKEELLKMFRCRVGETKDRMYDSGRILHSGCFTSTLN